MIRTIYVTIICSILLAAKLVSTKERLFYIYETEGWPKVATASLYKRDPNERLEHSLNQGAGPLVSLKDGEYHTDQYQLFAMIFNRALKDPRRTLDPSLATSFLIPYDFATDCAFYKNCARSSGVCYDFRKCPMGPEVEKLLVKSPWFRRNQGRDHVLIVGMNYAMDHYILKPKCKSLISGVCSNCTKFAIDDYSYMYSSNLGVEARGDKWHAIPFPSDFHWTRHVQRPFPWENTDRPILSSYIGSVRSYYGPARRLRGSIVHYCNLHPKHCVHSSYGLNGTRHSFKVDGHRPLQVAQKSVFCFQPIGDLMTRKGLFDSILQGCIPVVFDVLSASVMYTWHWEEAFWKAVIVEFVLHPVAHRYFDPVEALLKMQRENASLIAEKQALIRERVFALQYGLDGYKDVFQYQSNLPYTVLTLDPDIPPSFLPSNSSSSSRGGQTSSEGGLNVDGPPGVTPTPTDGSSGIHYHTRRPSSPSSSSSSSMGTSTDTASSSSRGNHSAVEVVSSAGSSWPVSADSGTPLRDAYDIVVDYFLDWHSGAAPDVRNGTVPECWDGWLDTVMNKCRVGTAPKS